MKAGYFRSRKLLKELKSIYWKYKTFRVYREEDDVLKNGAGRGIPIRITQLLCYTMMFCTMTVACLIACMRFINAPELKVVCIILLVFDFGLMAALYLVIIIDTKLAEHKGSDSKQIEVHRMKALDRALGRFANKYNMKKSRNAWQFFCNSYPKPIFESVIVVFADVYMGFITIVESPASGNNVVMILGLLLINHITTHFLSKTSAELDGVGFKNVLLKEYPKWKEN